MKCEVVTDAWLEAKQNGTIVSNAVQEHINTCPDCQLTIRQFEWLNSAMIDEPKLEPPPALKKNFEKFLEEIKSGNHGDVQPHHSPLKFIDKSNAATASTPAANSINTTANTTTSVVKKIFTQLWLAAGLILLLGVSILLVLVFRKEPQVHTEIVVATPDSINAFTSNSAFDRIQAINNVNLKTTQKQELLKTLANILLTDKNTNVRMAALYGLTGYVSETQVFDVILQALKTEKDPALQILLITTLGQKNNQKTQEAIRSIIDNSAVQKDVRSVAEQTLKTL